MPTVSLASKLNLKEGMAVAVLDAPDDVVLDLEELSVTDLSKADAVLLFATNRQELASRQGPFVEAARNDRVAWLAYPKGGQLGTDLNRDKIWELLLTQEVRPVRQISIDLVWSALRFRPL
jgi:hypothetical protein